MRIFIYLEKNAFFSYFIYRKKVLDKTKIILKCLENYGSILI